MDNKPNRNNQNHNENSDDIIIEDIDLKNDRVEEITQKPLSKNAHAKKLIDESKKLISNIDKEVYESKNIVSQHIDKLKEEKSKLTNATIIHSRVLLEKLNHPYTQEDDFEPFEVQLGTAHEDVSVKNVGSGWFTGLLLALLGMVATALAWLFVSNKVTGETIPLDKLPTKEFILEKIQDETLFSWMGGNPQVGMAVMGLSTLLIGYIIYKVRVSIKENKNLKIANDTLENSTNYVNRQQESKSEIVNLDKHITEVTPLIVNYRVLLDEQNAKLERIIHIEGELENHAEYQRTSQEIMADTEKLMESVERLISISITKEGSVNELSRNALIDARVLYESYLSKLYA
jgi:hypothetical protein